MTALGKREVSRRLRPKRLFAPCVNNIGARSGRSLCTLAAHAHALILIRFSSTSLEICPISFRYCTLAAEGTPPFGPHHPLLIICLISEFPELRLLFTEAGAYPFDCLVCWLLTHLLIGSCSALIELQHHYSTGAVGTQYAGQGLQVSGILIGWIPNLFRTQASSFFFSCCSLAILPGEFV